jgi:hypothetical protein
MKLSSSQNTASCVVTQQIRSFVIVFTRALHWFLSRARPIHQYPQSISLKSFLILSIHPRLCVPSGFFLFGFPGMNYMHSSSSLSYYIPWPRHHLWLHRSNYTLGRVQVMKLLIMQLCPASCDFLSLLSKYSSEHPILKHPKSMFIP